MNCSSELCAPLVLGNINIHGKDEVGISIPDRGWGVLYPYIRVPEENLEIKGMFVYPDVLLQRGMSSPVRGYICKPKGLRMTVVAQASTQQLS